MRKHWSIRIFVVLASLVLGGYSLDASAISRGVFIAHEEESGNVYRAGGEATLSASDNGGDTFETVAELSFSRSGRDIVRISALNGYADSDIVRLEAIFNASPSGNPLPVFIEQSKADFLSRFHPKGQGRLGFFFIPVTLAVPGNIVDVAKSDPDNFSILVQALELTGLDVPLQGPGPFTVFAPTNAAFGAVPEELLNALLADTDALSEVLLYHVLAGQKTAADVTAATMLETLLGPSVKVTVDNGNVFIDNAQVTITDVHASNGVIHVIDAVLLPPADTVDTAINAGVFTTLLAALEATGLDEALRGEGPFTVFAPTDAAFGALPTGAVDALLADPAVLTEVLLYHVLAGRVDSGAVVAAEKLETLLGKDVTVTVEPDGVRINDALVTAVDVQARNGIIHVIDAVLIPPQDPTILEIAEGAGSFATLLGALEATELDEVLAGEGPFTVLAPTDKAFEKVPSWLLNRIVGNPDLLTKVLLYHVIAGEYDAEELEGRRWLKTVNGAYVIANERRGNLFVNRARVTTADIHASNGIVHVIDEVLIPYNLFF